MSEDFPRLIEHAFPLKQASLDSVHEKNVRHGHISTLHIWPARRPLAACRAALIATLLPDPSAEPKPEGMTDEQWQKECAKRRQELCEKIGGKVVKKVERNRMPNGSIVEREKEETEGGILHWGRGTDQPAPGRGASCPRSGSVHASAGNGHLRHADSAARDTVCRKQWGGWLTMAPRHVHYPIDTPPSSFGERVQSCLGNGAALAFWGRGRGR